MANGIEAVPLIWQIPVKNAIGLKVSGNYTLKGLVANLQFTGNLKTIRRNKP